MSPGELLTLSGTHLERVLQTPVQGWQEDSVNAGTQNTCHTSSVLSIWSGRPCTHAWPHPLAPKGPTFLIHKPDLSEVI